MKTYKIEILREAFFSVVDRNKYVHFTIYVNPFIAPFGKYVGKKVGGKPLKCKAKISQLYGTPSGLSVSFTHFWARNRIGRTVCLKNTSAIKVKNIRWKTNPFDNDKIEQMCILLTKQLEASKMASWYATSETE